MDYGIPYLRICMIGSLGMMGQWVFDRFVMASGKSSLFLFTLSAVSVTNLILDPVLFIAVLSRLGNLSLIWMSFVLAEAVVIPLGMFLWKRESTKVLNPIEQIETVRAEGNRNSSKTEIRKKLIV
ncbi:hypothetical protein D3Z36_09805 [Lachnospiraceae bacterium]|nr:hypothetical protein [Lachnospiraceae bacterium]